MFDIKEIRQQICQLLPYCFRMQSMSWIEHLLHYFHHLLPPPYRKKPGLSDYLDPYMITYLGPHITLLLGFLPWSFFKRILLPFLPNSIKVATSCLPDTIKFLLRIHWIVYHPRLFLFWLSAGIQIYACHKLLEKYFPREKGSEIGTSRWLPSITQIIADTRKQTFDIMSVFAFLVSLVEDQIVPGNANVITIRNLYGLICAWFIVLCVAIIWNYVPTPIISFILIASIVQHLFEQRHSDPEELVQENPTIVCLEPVNRLPGLLLAQTHHTFDEEEGEQPLVSRQENINTAEGDHKPAVDLYDGNIAPEVEEWGQFDDDAVERRSDETDLRRTPVSSTKGSMISPSKTPCIGDLTENPVEPPESPRVSQTTPSRFSAHDDEFYTPLNLRTMNPMSGSGRKNDDRPPSDNDDWPPGEDDQPPGENDQPSGEDDRPMNEDDQPPGEDDQPPDEDDQPPGEDDQPSNDNDQPPSDQQNDEEQIDKAGFRQLRIRGRKDYREKKLQEEAWRIK